MAQIKRTTEQYWFGEEYINKQGKVDEISLCLDIDLVNKAYRITDENGKHFFHFFLHR